MDLKNAACVCLISLFSATLVVLIARALDSQAASQLEPQLTAIAEELHAIRKQGGIAAAGDAASETIDDGLVVYYFHSNKRCTDCRTIESVAKETLDSDFAAQLQREEIVWKTLNFQKPAGKKLADKFEVKEPVVVLVRMKGGEIAKSNRLDKCLALAGDKAALRKHVREEIQKMLPADGKSTPAAKKAAASSGPSRDDSGSKGPPDIPIPE
jgi:hypothetical protein